MKTLILFFGFIFFADAYIPKLSTVLSHIAGNNGGRNGLVIHRSVFFKEDNLASQETWYIDNADAMKVVVTGKNADQSDWSFEIFYKNGKRQTLSTTGETKTFSLSSEFFEQLLHYKSARALQNRLEAMQILPPHAMTNAQSPYVTMDRYRGAVAYRLGASDSKNSQPPPFLVVDQDSFVPLKLRLGSQIEIEFSGVTALDDGPTKEAIKQPTEQVILWKNTTVVTKTTSMDKVVDSKISSHLKLENKHVSMPTNENVKEFYSRFR
ncbi:MAG: hypothetical protein H6623_02475 [Bdellovibrionaceae bacterium]|nr:hypothetical protein [Pseudobdellovibrionaceae bacterium]